MPYLLDTNAVIALMKGYSAVQSCADEIVVKWINFFGLHKSIKPEHIHRRLK